MNKIFIGYFNSFFTWFVSEFRLATDFNLNCINCHNRLHYNSVKANTLLDSFIIINTAKYTVNCKVWKM